MGRLSTSNWLTLSNTARGLENRIFAVRIPDIYSYIYIVKFVDVGVILSQWIGLSHGGGVVDFKLAYSLEHCKRT